MDIFKIPTGLEILRMNNYQMKSGGNPDSGEQFQTLREIEVAIVVARQNLQRQKELKRKVDEIISKIE